MYGTARISAGWSARPARPSSPPGCGTAPAASSAAAAAPSGSACWGSRRLAPRRPPPSSGRSPEPFRDSEALPVRPEISSSLSPASQALLQRVAARPWAAGVYLAGSAALTLYLGHRPVRDLDLMTHTNRLAPQERRDLLADLVALDAGLRVETARDGYLFARSTDGVAVKRSEERRVGKECRSRWWQ